MPGQNRYASSNHRKKSGISVRGGSCDHLVAIGVAILDAALVIFPTLRQIAVDPAAVLADHRLARLHLCFGRLLQRTRAEELLCQRQAGVRQQVQQRRVVADAADLPAIGAKTIAGDILVCFREGLLRQWPEPGPWYVALQVPSRLVVCPEQVSCGGAELRRKHIALDKVTLAPAWRTAPPRPAQISKKQLDHQKMGQPNERLRDALEEGHLRARQYRRQQAP
eukprot:SAG31_NODE_14190_length_822_cov_1.283541_1_plen_223_part_00